MRYNSGMRWYKAFFEVVDSTNLQARRMVESGRGGAGLVVWAAHQTAGKGRRRADWWDLSGKSLLATLVFKGMPPLRATRLLCLAASAAAARAVGVRPLVKWPNDLVWGDRKLAGVLAETMPSGEVLAGIGINMDYREEELPDPRRIASLSMMGPLKVGPAGFLDLLLEETERRLQASNAELAAEYETCLALRGEAVRLDPPVCVEGRDDLSGSSLEGVVRGVDERGLLLLETPAGLLRVVGGGLSPKGLGKGQVRA